MLRNRSSKLVKICAFCGGEFMRRPGAIGQKFCSWKCYSVDRGSQFKELECDNCHRNFKRKVTRKATRVFCSHKCRGEGNRGDKNPQWRGKRYAHRGSDWKEQSQIARDRDENRCRAICHNESYVPARKEKLSVDHIVPYRLVLALRRIGADLNPNNLTNLISMCRSCHAKKTPSEAKILRGDLIGFLAVMRVVIDESRLHAALTLYGLSGNLEQHIVEEAKKHEPTRPRVLRKREGLSGSKNPNAKLTEEQVIQILERRSEPRRKLAEEFGTKRAYISAIVAGRKWRHMQPALLER